MLAPIYALAAADRLVRTGVATAGEIDVADLDVTARQDWTAEQWRRAEAAGLTALVVSAAETSFEPQLCQHSPEEQAAQDDLPEEIWWDESAAAWRTRFPPPYDFDGFEEGDPDRVDYERELTAEELDLIGHSSDDYDEDELAALAARYDAWIARARAERDAANGCDEEGDEDDDDDENEDGEGDEDEEIASPA